MAPRVRKVQTLSRDIGLGKHFIRNTKDVTPFARRNNFNESSASVRPTEESLANKLKASRNPSRRKKDGNTVDLETQDATRNDRITA